MTIEPTISNRSRTLDLLRGVAVVGILLANIEAFAHPAVSEGMGLGFSTDKVASLWDCFLTAFVNGKFRGMLAVLFGIGLYMQFQKRERLQGNWLGGYLKRTVWLGVFGAAHMIGIWFGDILLTYAVTAFIASFMVKVTDKALWWIIGITFFLMLLLGGFLGLAISLLGDFSHGQNPFGDMGALLGDEFAIFAHGSYLEQVAFRLKFFFLNLAGIPLIAIDLLPLFLIGFLIARHGVLTPGSPQGGKGRGMLLTCLIVGLALNLANGFLLGRVNYGFARILAEFGIGSILSLGYIYLLSKLSWSTVSAWMTRPLEKVGRMALTSYIFQSILCTAVFYSWGMGLFEGIGPLQEFCVVAAAWIIVIYFAELWLKFFDIGPLEWLLRSLTEGKMLPWKYKSRLEPEPKSKLGFEL